MTKEYRIVAFVHSVDLFERYTDYVELIALKDSRESYLKRIRYEYFYFHEYTLENDVDIWISLHDMTPRVKAGKLYTYCHNVSPFLRKDLSKLKYSATNVVFSYFYKYIYRINIKAATAVIVQQDWMRKAFLKMFPVKNVIVARPNVQVDFVSRETEIRNQKTIFAYASVPRYFKNFEVICEACSKMDRDDFEVWLTIDGTENKYSQEVKKKYSDVKCIKWIGLQPRQKLFDIYNQIDCFIFPSFMETWGLPISEFKLTGKTMLLADVLYAYEALGNYEKVVFFEPADADMLSRRMGEVIDGTIEYMPQTEQVLGEPFARDWDELIQLLIDGTGK